LIAVEQPTGTTLTDNGSTVDFRGALTGGGSAALGFTIRNTGNINLTGLGINFDGANPGDFSVTASPTPPVPPGGSTAFVVTFTPGGLGTRNAVLHLTSDDTTQSPFDIALTGIGVAPGDADNDGLTNLAEINIHGTNPNLADTDGDGINDGSEVSLATLGFNPLADSTALRTLLQNHAPAVGLYRASDMHTLAMGAPVFERNPSGEFQLTVDFETSPGLTTWAPLTGFTTSSTPAAGRVIVTFPPNSADAYFYRLKLPP
jgi:hypothetical protein